MHDNIPEGPPTHPVLTDGRFRYIRNLSPEALYIEKHVMGSTTHNPYWLSWMWASETDPHAYAMVRRYMRRPAEELYDTEADPSSSGTSPPTGARRAQGGAGRRAGSVDGGAGGPRRAARHAGGLPAQPGIGKEPRG